MAEDPESNETAQPVAAATDDALVVPDGDSAEVPSEESMTPMAAADDEQGEPVPDRVLKPARPWARSARHGRSSAANGGRKRSDDASRPAPSDPSTVLGPLRAELEALDPSSVDVVASAADPEPGPTEGIRDDPDAGQASTGWSEPTEVGFAVGVGAEDDEVDAGNAVDDVDGTGAGTGTGTGADLGPPAGSVPPPEPVYWSQPPPPDQSGPGVPDPIEQGEPVGEDAAEENARRWRGGRRGGRRRAAADAVAAVGGEEAPPQVEQRSWTSGGATASTSSATVPGADEGESAADLRHQLADALRELAAVREGAAAERAAAAEEYRLLEGRVLELRDRTEAELAEEGRSRFEAERRAAELAEEVAAARAEFHAELEQERERSADALRQLDGTLTDAHAQVAALTGELDAVRTELDQAVERSRADEARAQTAEAQLAETVQSVEAVQVQLWEAEDQRQAAERRAEAAEVQLVETAGLLEEERSALEALQADIQAYDERLTVERQRADSAEARGVDSAQALLADAEQQHNALRVELQAVSERVDIEAARAALSEQQLSELQRHLQDEQLARTQERAELERAVAVAEARADATQAVVADVEQQHDVLRLELQAAQERADSEAARARLADQRLSDVQRQWQDDQLLRAQERADLERSVAVAEARLQAESARIAEFERRAADAEHLSDLQRQLYLRNQEAERDFYLKERAGVEVRLIEIERQLSEARSAAAAASTAPPTAAARGRRPGPGPTVAPPAPSARRPRPPSPRP